MSEVCAAGLILLAIGLALLAAVVMDLRWRERVNRTELASLRGQLWSAIAVNAARSLATANRALSGPVKVERAEPAPDVASARSTPLDDDEGTSVWARPAHLTSAPPPPASNAFPILTPHRAPRRVILPPALDASEPPAERTQVSAVLTPREPPGGAA